ncbi:sensor histidine kinase NtrY-like [Litoreibacter roseus]|uniref:histidine kinase n=1 Tax=Litoreibacter roseus TaxID=2601869 RepID=A0A6N6JKQ5_9RHOB|nr:PAS domain-containing sensor histidine kinase [Litoreibacter roseus]GFE66896.1 PAS domain-containing sensor histidine kinase [Litoreibacter roseus]
MNTRTRPASWERLNQWRRRRRVQNAATLGLVALGPILAVLTYIGMGPSELDPSSRGIRLILLADLVYALVVSSLVAQKIARMIAARRVRSAGSQLHLRLTGVFALVALIPTVLVAIFAVITLNFGLEGWFSERVRDVVGSSLSAAQAYEEEQREDLRDDTVLLSRYIDAARQNIAFVQDSDFRQLLSQAQAQVQRGLKEAFIIDGAGALKTRGDRSYLFDYETPSPEDLANAANGKLVVIEDWANNEFRALLRLADFPDRYLYISREVDGEILSLLDDTQENVRLYEQLEDDRGRLLFEFGLLYLGFAVILILAAIWLGLWFAERLSRPVGRLAGAAQRVGAGDLDVRVTESRGDDEIAMLGRLFNQMTQQLKAQRTSLIQNTEQIERRRRLFDSVLSSVTAGVIGVDTTGQVTFVNRAAERLLSLPKDDHTGEPLGQIAPEFVDLFEKQCIGHRDTAQDEIRLVRRGKLETLLVRIATRRADDDAREGYVIAFDDVTDLVSAQKMAAWGDVARRIAHEIKNPLTPIQLSAERLKRKFMPLAGDEAEALEQYTGVIIRQTGDLRRIVDEFSKFARMPEPERRPADLINLVRDAVILQRSGQPDVTISLETDVDALTLDIDQTMLSQAMTNLIKNAGEATETYQEKYTIADYHPAIRVDVTTTDIAVEISIADNGTGLPADRARLFEPYVTTREKGTGLGLPIVKKIIEEHGGTLALMDAPIFDGNTHHGAMAVISLPRLTTEKQDTENVAAAAE